MKTINEIEILLTEKITENKNAIKKYTKKIEDAEKEMQQANADLTVAENDIDVEKYKNAKDAIWSAKHGKELYKKQKDKLSNSPLITKEEYNQLLFDITQNANAVHEEQNQRAATLIAELKVIADESTQTWHQANKLMHMLQREVYKEPTGVLQLPNGNTTFSIDKEYKNQETVHNFYQNKVKGSFLSKKAGEQPEPEQSTNKYWG